LTRLEDPCGTRRHDTGGFHGAVGLRIGLSRPGTLRDAMPDVDENLRQWGNDYAWPEAGARRTRFADTAHAEFFVNDGRLLSAADDSSIDFAFSFDSLVRLEESAIANFVAELVRVLTRTVSRSSAPPTRAASPERS
jgi:hypothetical protein